MGNNKKLGITLLAVPLYTNVVISMGSWADLHRDALEVVAERITRHIDFIHFAAVCKPWRSVVICNFHRLPLSLPLCYCLPRQNPIPLLLQCNDDEAGRTLEFFSTADRKYASRLFSPDIRQKWIAGSCNGWLVTVELDAREIQLLNPFTGAQVHLPSLPAFQHPEGDHIEDEDYGFVEKAVISSEPIDDCIVMAIVSNISVLSFCRPGDEKWTNVEGCTVYLSDVIPYKGEFCAISEKGTVIACDAAGDGNVKLIADSSFEPRKRYLAESASGDLLHVARIKDEETELITTHFEVYKLEVADESRITETRDMHLSKWVKMESLGDQALFLGRNCSLCLPTQSVSGCKRDCIYFTNDDCIYFTNDDYKSILQAEDDEHVHVLWRGDIGVYDMAYGSIEPFGELKVKSYTVPPIWVSPNPW